MWGYTSTDTTGTTYGHVLCTMFNIEHDSEYVFDILFCKEICTLYIIDIYEIYESSLYPRQPKHVFDMKAYQDNDIYATEWLDIFGPCLCKMYPEYTRVRIFTCDTFNEELRSYTKRHHKATMESIAVMVPPTQHIPDEICGMISQYSLPSWCLFDWNVYNQSSSLHMKWGKSHTADRNVQTTCCALVAKTLSTMHIKDIHKTIHYHTPLHDTTLSYTAPLEELMPYAKS
jgi:hypothetical protein